MGYDLHMVNPPTRYFDGYLQLNMAEMDRLYDAMRGLDMLYETRSPEPWPEAEPQVEEAVSELSRVSRRRHITASDLEVFATAGDVDTDEFGDHLSELRKHLAIHPSGGQVIPSHKLRSNDGWIVTSEEIKAALAVYDSHSAVKVHKQLARAGIETEKHLSRWSQWTNYLHRAVDHDGFEVH